MNIDDFNSQQFSPDVQTASGIISENLIHFVDRPSNTGGYSHSNSQQSRGNDLPRVSEYIAYSSKTTLK